MTTSRMKYFGRNAISAAALSALLLGGSAMTASADHGGPHGGGILGGAAAGAIIGGAIKGKKGVLPGAIIGGVVGGAASSRARPAPPPPGYYAPPPPPQPAYQNGLVYNIQASLTRLGYNPGPIDGVYGQRTAEAISAYEYNKRLPVTGQPSPGLLQMLQADGG